MVVDMGVNVVGGCCGTTYEHIRQVVPGLLSIDVTLSGPYDVGYEVVLLEVLMRHRHLEYDPTQRELGKWEIVTFPPEVLEHFVILVVYGIPDER